MIHLGYGVEFQQPAIVVEALAQAATHDSWIGEYLLAAEKAARKSDKPSKSLFQLQREARANDKLKASPHWNDANKVRDGIFVRAKQEMVDIGSQWTVKEDELEQKTAEMINFASGLPSPHPVDALHIVH